VVLDPFITDLAPEVSKDKGSTAANSHLTTQGFERSASPGCQDSPATTGPLSVREDEGRVC
jgi:hypothetical protein